MNRTLKKALAVVMVAGAGIGSASAQGWFICVDPTNTMPLSVDYGENPAFNDLFACELGVSGTVTYGGANGPCFAPAPAVGTAVGALSFGVGNIGSSQTDFDNNMPLTFGFPTSGAPWTYATINIGTTRERFGTEQLVLAFAGLSDHYTYMERLSGTTRIKLRADIIGDACRAQWDLINEGTTPETVGLWFGQWVALLAEGALPPGAIGPGKGGPDFGIDAPYVTIPGQKPPVFFDGFSNLVLQNRYIRTISPQTFPQQVDFAWGQTMYYGLQVVNGPTAETTDNLGNSEVTQVDEFVLGDNFFLLGAPRGGGGVTFTDFIFPDSGTSEPAYIQKYNNQNVAAGATRTIISYYRSTWGISNYSRPYSVVMDSPKLLGTDDNNTPGGNGLTHNPMTIRIYVDNTRGFSTIQKDIEIDDVKITLTLPTGMSLAPGEVALKTIARIPPRALDHVDFNVVADGIEFGQLQYSVKVDPIPGPVKVVTGFINVAATPRVRLEPGANLITTPFLFPDSSWEVVLGMTAPTQFQAFEWDPQQKGYIISTSAARGKGTFIVPVTGSEISQPLLGGPVSPPDTATGAPLIQLKSGWNLIANPYSYSFPIGQMVGVSATNPTQSFSWDELVQQGIVNGFLSFWDAFTQSYKFAQGDATLLQPNHGYWLFVNTSQDVTLEFPPIFAAGLDNSTRAAAPGWTQTDQQWRVQFKAQSAKSVDDQVFVGKAKTAKDATALRAMKPPMAPTQDVSMSIQQTVNGLPVNLAQSLSEKGGKQQWTMQVQSVAAGPVTITWPNLASIPKNVRVRIIDTASNTSRDLRQSSGYTFTAAANSTRTFQIQTDLGANVAPVIGNVVVTGGRAVTQGQPPLPIQINYTLSTAASTTIRVLSGSGREVFAITRSRSDNSGANSATWTLKDNANRAVAPGSYIIEIVAETANGDRVRKIATVPVIR